MPSEKDEKSYILEVPDLSLLPSVSFDERKMLPKVGGVYFVFAATTAVLYVGSTKNLYQRWVAHHRGHQCAETGGVRIAWYLEAHAGKRLAMEHYCIDMLRPLYQQVPTPLRRNKKGHEVYTVVLHVPAPLFRHVQKAADEEIRSVPNQILWILERLVRSGQFYKWTGEAPGISHHGEDTSWRKPKPPQLRLFEKGNA